MITSTKIVINFKHMGKAWALEIRRREAFVVYDDVYEFYEGEAMLPVTDVAIISSLRQYVSLYWSANPGWGPVPDK